MEIKKRNKVLFINRLENKGQIKFDGIVPNKLGNIIYIKNEKGILKTKSNRPVLPIYQDEKFTYYFRLQGINKKQVNWTLPELLKSIKAGQYGNLPKKDSWLCFDIVFKMETKNFNYIFGLDINSSIPNDNEENQKIQDFQNGTLPLTLEEQLELTETTINIIETNLDKVSMVEISTSINELIKFAKPSYTNEKLMYSKNIGKPIYSTFSQINHENLDSIIRTVTFNRNLSSTLDNPNLSNPLEMNIFLGKLENQKRKLETEIKASKLNDGSNNNGSGPVSGSDNSNNHSEPPKSDNKFRINNKFDTDIYIKSFNDIKNQIRAKKWWEFWKTPKNKVSETQNLAKIDKNQQNLANNSPTQDNLDALEAKNKLENPKDVVIVKQPSLESVFGWLDKAEEPNSQDQDQTQKAKSEKAMKMSAKTAEIRKNKAF